MITNWLITGDTHGKIVERASYINHSLEPEKTALIVLGDFGINFYLNKTDYKNKQKVNTLGYTFYAVRGNHEERPENLGYPKIYDEEVKGYVYMEKEFPNIKYFIDGEEYVINGKRVLVLGGAYSIDKDYRIENYMQKNGWCGWFKDEQLSSIERDEILNKVYGETYDYVLSHTCPLEWQPISLFLSGIKGEDNSMEKWLSEVRDNITITEKWYFGHYHGDKTIAPKARLVFEDVIPFGNHI